MSSLQAEHLVTVGAPCPDHLVHTKRVPLWIPYDPEADDAEALRARIVLRRSRTRRSRSGTATTPQDIAAAVLHFASDARSSKTTGNLLNVDGGVPAAYPR